MENLIEKLQNFCEASENSGNVKSKYLCGEYIKWLSYKTDSILNEKDFKAPIRVKRAEVYWIEFGFNIGKEFGGKHPAIIWRVFGSCAIVIPLTSKEPSEYLIKNGSCVEIGKVYNATAMKRWAKLFEIRTVSIQRFDFNNLPKVMNIKGSDLDNIRQGMIINKLWTKD